MEIINMSNPGLYVVNTTTNSYVVYVSMKEFRENEALEDLCRAIVRLEREGRIVTSVQKLYPDGHRPRVTYRKTAAYKRAKEERDDKIISALYVAYIDSGKITRVPCKVNLGTHEVFDIDFRKEDPGEAKCVLEYVQIYDSEMPLFNIDPLIAIKSMWSEEKLAEIKNGEKYWYSLSENKLI